MEAWKGHEHHLRALAKLSRDVNWRCWIAGGAQRPAEIEYAAHLKRLVAELGLAERVCFLGQLPGGETVRAQLDWADLFVLPSRTDALPRAMIEAMARGLPCIGTTVGGIPELLPCEDMVPSNDAGALARKIQEVASDPMRMIRMSARNIEKAKEYREEILHERRVSFYKHVRRSTEAWLSARH